MFFPTECSGFRDSPPGRTSWRNVVFDIVNSFCNGCERTTDIPAIQPWMRTTAASSVTDGDHFLFVPVHKHYWMVKVGVNRGG